MKLVWLVLLVDFTSLVNEDLRVSASQKCHVVVQRYIRLIYTRQLRWYKLFTKTLVVLTAALTFFCRETCRRQVIGTSTGDTNTSILNTVLGSCLNLLHDLAIALRQLWNGVRNTCRCKLLFRGWIIGRRYKDLNMLIIPDVYALY